MLFDPDESCDAERAEVTKVGAATESDFVGGAVVRVSGRGEPVAKVGGRDDRFTPESRRQGGVDYDGPGHCEDDANSALSDAVLMRGAYASEFTHDVGFGEEGVNHAVAEFGAIVGADKFCSENGVIASDPP